MKLKTLKKVWAKIEDLGLYFERVILYPVDAVVDLDIGDRFCVGIDRNYPG